jgi:hypothetical protein
MPRKWTRRECFEHFGASCKNPQWSGSAKSADGRVVVMCMWQDEIKREGDRMVYQSLTPRRGEQNRPGAKERLENLKWAREHCDGLARVVVMRANDTKADPRSIAECFPHDKLVMRITHIDEATGEFRAESA